MSTQKVRVITDANVDYIINGREDMIVFNITALAASFELGPSYGDGRCFAMKNIGTATITLTPSGTDIIWEDSSVATKDLLPGESISLTDAVDGTWVCTYTDFETTPLAEGGTGITGSGVTNHYYVDCGRTDTYTQDGSILRPYKTIKAAIEIIQILANAQISLGTQVAYDTTRYIIDVSGGIYADTITIGNMKYLGIQLNGATISGQINITTTQVGGPVTDDYSKVEFIGSPSSRAYRGRRGYISGNIIMTRNNASLMYVNFTGVEVAGNVSVGTATADSNGSWVVGLQNAYFSVASKFISCYTADPTAYLMIESYAYNVIKCKIAKQDGSATQVELYNCNNTSFENDINIIPTLNQTVKNCSFTSTKAFSIVAVKTLYIDASSWKQLMAGTETLTGMTISFLDKTGVDVTPVARTNHPVIGANDINANIAALDACIGTDGDITPSTRTTGQIVVDSTVNAKFETVDQVIGADNQMPTSSINVTRTQTIYQNLRALDTYKSVRSLRYKVGNVGVASSDFNFASAANADEQSIDMGEILPAKCRIQDAMIYTDAAFTNLGALTTDLGLTTGTDGLIAAADNTAIDAVMATANAGAFISTPSKDAQHVWLNVKPTNNWDSASPVGRMSVYITFIDLSNL